MQGCLDPGLQEPGQLVWCCGVLLTSVPHQGRVGHAQDDDRRGAQGSQDDEAPDQGRVPDVAKCVAHVALRCYQVYRQLGGWAQAKRSILFLAPTAPPEPSIPLDDSPTQGRGQRAGSMPWTIRVPGIAAGSNRRRSLEDPHFCPLNTTHTAPPPQAARRHTATRAAARRIKRWVIMVLS